MKYIQNLIKIKNLRIFQFYDISLYYIISISISYKNKIELDVAVCVCVQKVFFINGYYTKIYVK